jgi:glutathione synthase/RimK-type ligase-like ATP-grasp enzyme
MPTEIEDKIIKFMKKVGMISGSLDVLVSTDKKYYFLEVNPIGLFAQVSQPCNYYLEKKVAEYLINYDQ